MFHPKFIVEATTDHGSIDVNLKERRIRTLERILEHVKNFPFRALRSS